MDSYKILEIPAWSSKADIKQAYKRLALLYHPDKAGEHSTAHFQTIINAYETIMSTRSPTSTATTAFGTTPRTETSAHEVPSEASRWTSKAYMRWNALREEHERQCGAAGASAFRPRWAGSLLRSRPGKASKEDDAAFRNAYFQSSHDAHPTRSRTDSTSSKNREGLAARLGGLQVK